jgi:hypothetical protein
MRLREVSPSMRYTAPAARSGADRENFLQGLDIGKDSLK